MTDGKLPEAVMFDWNRLSDELQLVIAGSALKRAAETLARQAEALAGEMDAGALADRGGSDALRLFAAITRVGGRDTFAAAGHA